MRSASRRGCLFGDGHPLMLYNVWQGPWSFFHPIFRPCDLLLEQGCLLPQGRRPIYLCYNVQQCLCGASAPGGEGTCPSRCPQLFCYDMWRVSLHEPVVATWADGKVCCNQAFPSSYLTFLSLGFLLLAAGLALREALATIAEAASLLYLPPFMTFLTALLKDTYITVLCHSGITRLPSVVTESTCCQYVPG